MRGLIFMMAALGCPSLGMASIGWDFQDGSDTTVYIKTSGQKSLVVDGSAYVGDGLGGDELIIKSGYVSVENSSDGLVSRGFYYGLHATADDGTAVSANGGAIGVAANGTNNGVMGTATGGIGPIGVSGEATGTGGIGVAGNGGDIGVHGTGGDTGVVGTSMVTGGIGVRAQGHKYGLYSLGSGTSGYGIWAEGNLVGVRGESPYWSVEGYNGYRAVTGQTPVSGGIGVYGGNYEDYSYGVYGEAWGTGSYAGFFDGNVAVTGDCDPCSPSDEKFKKDVKDLDGALAKVMALKPKSYRMKTEEFKDKIALAKGNQYGFMAQELQAVLPDMVHDVTMPGRVSREEGRRGVKKESFRFKGVSYNDLIPILVRAIQEQQAEIEALKGGR